MSTGPTPLGRPTPTFRGWWFASGAGVLTVAGIVVQNAPLIGLGVAGLLLLLVAHVQVMRARPEVAVQRHARPSRVHVGQECGIVLEGETLARTPLLMITELVDEGLRVARFALPPSDAGTPIRATYRVPTTRRGLHQLGPLLAFVVEPFGLARRAWEIAETSDLVVRPRLHRVASPRRGHGGEPDAHAEGQRLPTLQTASEFLALRDYEPGDDPRRVHWRSTARTGELMVRQDEAAAPGRVVLALDTRPATPPGPAFEVAVEAVASIAARCRDDRIPVEAVATSGAVLGRPTPSGFEMLLDQLALVEPAGPDHLGALCAQLATRLGVGGVVLATASPDDALVAAIAPLFGRVVLTVVATAPPATTAIPGLVDASAMPFAEAWNRSMTLQQHRWTPATSRSPLRSLR